MEKFIQLLKKIFFLPPMPALLIALFGYTLVIMVAAVPIEIDAIRYLSYFSSAYALIITITGFPHLKRFIKKVRWYIETHPFMKRFKSTKIGSRFLDDVRFRTEISLYQGLLINSLYIAMKMFSGIYYRSVWFIALAFYYILLVVMRVMLLRKGKKNREPMIEELRRYRMCGITLLLMSQTASIGIYPEGTVSTEKLLPFKNGAFKIAKKAKCPIVVAVIKDSEKVLKNAPFRKTDVYLDLVGVLDSEFVSSAKTEQIGSTVREMMERAMVSHRETAEVT